MTFLRRMGERLLNLHNSTANSVFSGPSASVLVVYSCACLYALRP